MAESRQASIGNNPAGRLHQVLHLCRSHRQALGDEEMFIAWRKVFLLPESVEPCQVLRKIGLLCGLPSLITEQVERFDDLPPRLYLGWRPQLERAFGDIAIHAPLRQFADHLSETLMITIEFCAQELGLRCPEMVVTPFELEEIGKMAKRLREDLLDAELDADQKNHLLFHSLLIINAVEDYQILGSGALQNALDTSVGSILSRRAVAVKTRESELGARFWTMIGKISVALQMSKSPKEMGDGVFRVLTTKQA